MSRLDERAFGLTSEEMDQIRYADILSRRKQESVAGIYGSPHLGGFPGGRPPPPPPRRFSDKLSLEAQIAMQLALEDTRAMQEEIRTKSHLLLQTPEDGPEGDGEPSADHIRRRQSAGSEGTVATTTTTDSSGSSSSTRSRSTISKVPSFGELYDRNSSARMRQDITDEKYDEEKETRRSLGGGKVDSALEIIEIVNHDDPKAGILDEEAISELARTNSVDKCLVWMEATELLQGPSLTSLPGIPEVD